MVDIDVSQSNITYMVVWAQIRKEDRIEKLSLQGFRTLRLRVRNSTPSLRTKLTCFEVFVPLA